jgi:hypothetical protein
VIRAKIRKLGFFFSDFSNSKDGYTISDFEALIRSGQIKVIGENYKPTTKATTATKPIENSVILKQQKIKNYAVVKVPTIDITEVETKLMYEKEFKSADTIDNLVSANPGLYCIRITDINKLPKPFDTHLTDRKHNIIYIGIATKSLKTRFLNQELRAKGHGTFFRSIGAFLGYRPPKGSLLTKKNKYNYKFSKTDEQKIIKWINENLIVNWINFSGDFKKIETELLNKYRPLINIAKNPSALQLLLDLRTECVEIANAK